MKVLAISLALNAGLWGLALFLFPHGSPATVLHYTAVIGVDFVGGSRHIYVLPLFGAFFIIINGFLGYFIRSISRRAASLLWSTTIVIQVILAVALIILWQLNR